MSQMSKLLDDIIAGRGDKPPSVETLELPRPSRWEPGKIWTEWQVDPRMFHGHGALFGGYLAALADNALALAALSVLHDDEHFTTSDLRVSFFRAISSGTLRIEARVVHRGKSMIHVEVDFIRDDDKLAAKATATQVVLKQTR